MEYLTPHIFSKENRGVDDERKSGVGLLRPLFVVSPVISTHILSVDLDMIGEIL